MKGKIKVWTLGLFVPSLWVRKSKFRCTRSGGEKFHIGRKNGKSSWRRNMKRGQIFIFTPINMQCRKNIAPLFLWGDVAGWCVHCDFMVKTPKHGCISVSLPRGVKWKSIHVQDRTISFFPKESQIMLSVDVIDGEGESERTPIPKCFLLQVFIQ